MGAGGADLLEPVLLQCPYGTETYSVLEADDRDPATDYPKVLSILSSLFDRVVIRNDRLALNIDDSATSGGHGNKLTVFHGLRAPSITISKYLDRIYKYANCSPGCFVVAYIYIDRLIHRHPEFTVTSLNVHRLLVTSLLVAAKFLDDAYFNNAYYAKVGGVTTSEMNRLELEFLFRLDFKLHVTPSLFGNYCTHLERELALSEVQRPRKLVRMTGSVPFSVQTEKIYDCTSRDQYSVDSSMDVYEVQTPPRDAEPYGRPHMFEDPSPMVQ